MFAVGDHDMDSWVDSKPLFHGITRRFQFPWETSHLFYSYEVGPAHVIVLHYADYGPDTDQMAFVRQDLSEVDRERTPWVLVITHRPMYVAKRNTVVAGKFRQYLEPELYGKVDFVFAGHIHGYQRFHAMYEGHRDSKGPVHITAGTGGACVGDLLSFCICDVLLSLSLM